MLKFKDSRFRVLLDLLPRNKYDLTARCCGIKTMGRYGSG